MLAIHLSSMLSQLELLSSLLTAKPPPLSWRMFLWWWWWWWWRLCSSRSLQCLGDCLVSVCVCVCVCVCVWVCVCVCVCVCVAVLISDIVLAIIYYCQLRWGWVTLCLQVLCHHHNWTVVDDDIFWSRSGYMTARIRLGSPVCFNPPTVIKELVDFQQRAAVIILLWHWRAAFSNSVVRKLLQSLDSIEFRHQWHTIML